MRIAAAEGCFGLDIAGRRYNTDKTGHIDLPAQHARQAIAEGGAFIPGVPLAVNTKVSYRCPQCGRHPFFNTCGRCGVPCIKE